MLSKINKFNFLLIIVIALNFLQALLTPIIEDEAYYWKFSNHLDWGFFDHPPMVAFLIFLNKLIFTGSFSIRFLTVILMALTIKITWMLIPEINKKHKHAELLFFGLFISIPVCNIYGFITTADIALLFFGALYLLIFKKFINNKSIINVILLGVVSALLLYSKYHGGIVILLSILFNIKLLKNVKIYISGIVALLILSPHLYWQYQHDFITLNYHLFSRTDGSFKIKNILEYVFGSALILNPALLLLLFWLIKIKKIKISNYLNFHLKLIIGFLLFFLINAFRSKIEAHWVAFVMIPLIIVLHSIITTKNISFKIVKPIIVVSITVMLIIRFIIVLDLPLQTEFHKEGPDFFNNINKVASSQNIAFMNSYQKAAKYSYYTGNDAYSLNNTFYRKNQYDFWNYESKLHGNDVFVISNWPSKQYDSIIFDNGESILGKTITDFQMFSSIDIQLKQPIHQVNTGATYTLFLNITNPYNYSINLDQKNLNYKIALEIKKGKFRKFISIPLTINTLLANGDTEMSTEIIINKDIPTGDYKGSFVMMSGILPYQLVSKRSFNLTIKNTIQP